MTRCLLTLSIALASLESLQAQEPWANRMFQGVTHNFGNVPPGAQLHHSFKLVNIWKAPLDITEVRVSCGCVTATVTKNRLLPGESAELKILMNGKAFTGSKSVDIFVTVGPQYISTARLTVSANAAQAEGVAMNSSGIQFGTVSKGQPATQSIEIRNLADANWQVTEILKTQTAPFELAVENLPGPGRAYRLTARLKTDSYSGEFREEVTLKTNDVLNPTLKVQVSGKIKGTLTYDRNVRLAGLRLGADSVATIVISADRPFKMTAINGLTADMKMQPLPLEARQAHILSVQVNPQALGDFRRVLTVQTDLNESATINLEGTAKQ